MTEATVAFLDYLRNIGKEQNADFLRDGIQVLTQALMEVEISQQVGAERYERRDARQGYRNGYRERLWQTRVGDIALRIPKVRDGSYFPSFLEPRRRPEQALLAVVQQAYIEGVSSRKVDDLVQSLGLSGMDKSALSRICQQLDAVVDAFRNRPLASEYPYVWLDAVYVKARVNGRVVSQELVIATGVRRSGERDVLGLEVGAAENHDFWLDFLRQLVRRGLRGVQLVISDAHEGLKEAIQQNPQDDGAFNNLGVALGQQGRWNESLASLRQATTLNPNNTRAQYNLGVTSYYMGDKNAAVQQYAILTASDPTAASVSESPPP